MKKLPMIHVAVASSLLCLVAPAQAMPWHWGVRAGLNAARFGGEFGRVVQPDLRYGLNAGVVVEAAFVPWWSLHTGAAFASKGGQADSQGTDAFGNPTARTTTVWEMDYIDVPVLVRADLLRSAAMSPYLELGPTVSVPVRGQIDPGLSGVPRLDIKNDMRTLDFGFAAGAGVRFAAGPGRLGAELRYTRGFADSFTYKDNAPTVQQALTFALSWTR